MIYPPSLFYQKGALHWGMEFAGYGGSKGYSRLLLGAIPVMYAWPTLTLDPTSALIAQWIGFTALWYADMKATQAGWSEYEKIGHQRWTHKSISSSEVVLAI